MKSVAVANPVPELISILDPAAELAVLARALDAIGFAERNLGHITYQQDEDRYYTLPYHRGWGEVKASEIIVIDGDGTVVQGDHAVTPAIRLHLELHRARRGCKVTIHNHPRYATIYAAAHRLPPVFDQTAAVVVDDECVVYGDYPGSVENAERARSIVEVLGDANYALLANHGVFVIADTVPQAWHRANALEWRCKQAWHVESIGGGVAMPDAGIRALVDLSKSYDDVFPEEWEWAVRNVLRTSSDVLD